LFLSPILDSYLRCIERNVSKKIFRAKTPRRKVKNISDFSELGVLCGFARVISFPILGSQPRTLNMFG
jgi:hypothetical protein